MTRVSSFELFNEIPRNISNRLVRFVISVELFVRREEQSTFLFKRRLRRDTSHFVDFAWQSIERRFDKNFVHQWRPSNVLTKNLLISICSSVSSAPFSINVELSFVLIRCRMSSRRDNSVSRTFFCSVSWCLSSSWHEFYFADRINVGARKTSKIRKRFATEVCTIERRSSLQVEVIHRSLSFHFSRLTWFNSSVEKLKRQLRQKNIFIVRDRWSDLSHLFILDWSSTNSCKD